MGLLPKIDAKKQSKQLSIFHFPVLSLPPRVNAEEVSASDKVVAETE